MAEGVLSTAVQTIANVLITEAQFLSGVRDKVELLKVDLRQMQSLLKDADNQQQGNEHIRNWVAEIRDIAYDAEDIIESFILKISSRQVGLKRFFYIFTRAPNLHEIGTQIEALRAKTKTIYEGIQALGIIKFPAEAEGSSGIREKEMQQLLRRTYPHDEEDDLISLESCTRDLMARLLASEDRLHVVSIVGMGGLGKTTLAKKVYNHLDVKRHFDCHCWVFLSQQFSVRDVLLEILRQLVAYQETWGKLQTQELVTTLYNVLKDKRYLVVLDDIWNLEAWTSLCHAFPREKRGSKVLFTTRIKEVASSADPSSSPIELPFLTNEESWSLLSKKAFPRDIAEEDDGHNIPSELEKLGREMVKKCGGLPLAIVVLGGLLATKKSRYEWEAVQRNINAQFNKLEQQHQYGGVYGILALSYQALPWYLKQCFLYLSQFPEDYEICKRVLVRMWIAEGFVSQNDAYGDATLEDVGEQYLEELAGRCMIQVSQRDHAGIRIKRFRIHDLMRDMCVSRAREENFLEVIEHGGYPYEEMKAGNCSSILTVTTTHSRRIAVQCRIALFQGSREACVCVPTVGGNPHLRSLFYFANDYGYFKLRKEVRFTVKNFKLLRVLNFVKVDIDGDIPNEIGNLIFLRYLGFRDIRIGFELPASISKLRSLYTLDVRYCDIKNLLMFCGNWGA